MNIVPIAKRAVTGAPSLAAWAASTAALLLLVPNKWAATGAGALTLVVHVVWWVNRNQSAIVADAGTVQKVISAMSDWDSDVAEIKSVLHQLAGESERHG